MLDLYLKRLLEQVVEKQKRLSQDEQKEYNKVVEEVEKQLKGILSDLDESMLDETDVIQSQVALLKKLVEEAEKSGGFVDAINSDDEEEEEDETLRMILKLQERRKSEKREEQDERPIVNRRKVNFTSPNTERSQTMEEKNQEDVIDDLTTSMVEHATLLKEHSKAFQKLLKEDKHVMGEAEQALNTATGRFQRESGNLRGVTKRSWRDGWLAIGYFCLAVLIFFFMYIFIRLT